MQMTEVAVEIVLTAEIRYRGRAIHQYRWRVERKAELEEEERQLKLEAERAEKESSVGFPSLWSRTRRPV